MYQPKDTHEPNRYQSTLLSWTFIWPCIALIAMFIWQFTSMQGLTGGFFSYALDDAYIHLALSENIMKGHYGVNLQDYSAPSSSILWSFLMAPFATWQYWPLCVNILISLAALWLWNRLVQDFFPDTKSTPLKIALNICFIFLANLVGVSFTGMENLLQLLLSMIILLGIFNLIEKKPTSSFFLIAIVLAPLVRYETISLSGTALFFFGDQPTAPKSSYNWHPNAYSFDWLFSVFKQPWSRLFTKFNHCKVFSITILSPGLNTAQFLQCNL